MRTDYTPAEDEIRKVWGIAVPQDRRPERDAAFDRWLEAHDREVATRAWDDGYEAGHADARAVQSTFPRPTRNPYRIELGDSDG